MHAATRALNWKSAAPVVDDLWLPDFPTEAQSAMESKVQDIERWAAEGCQAKPSDQDRHLRGRVTAMPKKGSGPLHCECLPKDRSQHEW